jgi:hypothetical protein
MCLVVFQIFASSLHACVLCHIVAVLVFDRILVLYLRTRNILKPTYIKDCNYYSRACFCNQSCVLSQFTVQVGRFHPFTDHKGP